MTRVTSRRCSSSARSTTTDVIASLTFDDDDFENAYQELERRYYGGEGAPFAEAGAVMSKLVAAGSRGDNDAVFGCSNRECGWRAAPAPSSSRALDELRSSVDEFKAMVRSSRIWCAAVRWLSPTCAVVRHEREAVGHEGQSYEWSRIYALESHGGRFTGGCEFDIEFEDEAFAYAEERLRASASRLAVTNRASVVAERLAKAIGATGDLGTRCCAGLRAIARTRIGGASAAIRSLVSSRGARHEQDSAAVRPPDDEPGSGARGPPSPREVLPL